MASCSPPASPSPDACATTRAELSATADEPTRRNSGHFVGKVFTQLEHHRGKDVWITRKGAIKASVGDEGVIPGSMGTRSYVVSGKGSAASYDSCSHGAGRRMSRGRARKELTVASLREAMVGQSWNDRDADKLVDEHPSAYKDIDQVMADQADLVTVQHTLRQVFNYKGV